MNTTINSTDMPRELDAAGAPAGELVATGILKDWYQDAYASVLSSGERTPGQFADDDEDDPCGVDPAGTGWSADSGASEVLQDK